MTPTDLLNVAQLGITSGTAWADKYPTMTAMFITQQDYLQHHLDMRTTALAQIANNDARNQTIAALKGINTTINTHTKFLKNYLLEEFADQAKNYYTGYGMVLDNKSYRIAIDNDRRMSALDTLIAELQKANNPLANKKYGLAFWIALRDGHRFHWTNLKNYDGNRSMNSDSLTQAKKEALGLQSKLRSLLKINYSSNYKAVWRDFGFQNEKY